MSDKIYFVDVTHYIDAEFKPGIELDFSEGKRTPEVLSDVVVGTGHACKPGTSTS